MIIVKAGGSAITDKKTPFSIKKHTLKILAKELKSAKEDIILCHGGGSFGHPLALEYDIAEKISTEKQFVGISKINLYMRKLSNIVCKNLMDAGCRSFAFQTSAIVTSKKGRIEKFYTCKIKKILEMGFIPVLYGDAVVDSKYNFSIISGDQIIRKLAEDFAVSRVIFLTDVDGLYDTDPKKSGSAKLIDEVSFDALCNIDAGTTGDITGGMRGKVKEIMLLKDCVKEVVIVNLEKEGSLKKALAGENPGTRIFKEG
ncbi:MAG: isopentenyl phosphate kinase [Candidatus Methanofastidiosia archaeon]